MEKFLEFWDAWGELTASLICVLTCVAIVVIGILLNKKGKSSSKRITFGAICLALSVVLNMLPAWELPNGGSITLGRLVPLLIYSYIFGAPSGFVLGFTYGLLDFIMEPVFVHPIQFLLDYPIAFCCVGLAGLFQKNNVLSKFSVYLGAALAGIMRFLSSTISGTVYWGTPWAGSVAYNSAILVDMAICIVIIFLLFRSKSFVNYLNSRKPNFEAIEENPDDIKL